MLLCHNLAGQKRCTALKELLRRWHGLFHVEPLLACCRCCSKFCHWCVWGATTGATCPRACSKEPSLLNFLQPWSWLRVSTGCEHSKGVAPWILPAPSSITGAHRVCCPIFLYVAWTTNLPRVKTRFKATWCHLFLHGHSSGSFKCLIALPMDQLNAIKESLLELENLGVWPILSRHL